MLNAHFAVQQLDHVELFVPDRYEGAKWYADVLGLEIVKDLEDFAKDPKGPLMIQTKVGGTKLALFEGVPSPTRRKAGFSRVAFRVDAHGFSQFISELPILDLRDSKGGRVTRQNLVNHQKAFSIYFNDPWGHALELTTYDYQLAKTKLEDAK